MCCGIFACSIANRSDTSQHQRLDEDALPPPEAGRFRLQYQATTRGPAPLYRTFAARPQPPYPMITVISGTNRPDSRTVIFARYYAEELQRAGAQVKVLDLAELHHGYFQGKMYDPLGNDPQLVEWQREYVKRADKLAVFVPEYNGSYPGVLKLFLDGISVVDYVGNFGGKHVALIGVSTGRAGNLRGIDHLADVFAHMGAWVLPNRLPLSSVEGLLEGQSVKDENTKSALRKQAQQLIEA